MTRRTAPLPSNWAALRRRVARRDGNQCQLRYPGCLGYAPLGKGGETDHRVGAAAGGGDDEGNLQHVCAPCHRIKTAHEANAVRPSRRRRPVSHPGLV